MSELYDLWEGFPRSTHQRLTIALQRLFLRHLGRDRYTQTEALTELERLLGPLPDPRLDFDGNMREVARYAPKIGENRLGALLIAAYSHDNRSDHEQHKARELAAWVLSCALIRGRQKRNENAILVGLDDTRLTIKTKSPILAEIAPLGDDLETVSATIRRYRQDKGLDRNHARYLGSINFLLWVTLNEKPPITRINTGGRAEHTRAPVTRSAPDRDHISYLLGDTGLDQPEDFAGSHETQEADSADRTDYLEDAVHRVSYAPRAPARRSFARRAKAIARRDQNLTSEYDPLTPLEVQKLLQHLRSGPDPMAKAVLAYLCLGDVLNGVKPSDIAVEAFGSTGFAYALTTKLPEMVNLLEDQNEALSGDVLIQKNLILLELPIDGTALAEVLSRTNTRDLQAYLGQLSSLTRPFRLGRILKYKGEWLHAEGADAAIIGFLTGQSPAHRAQLHYTQFQKADLLQWHGRYLSHLMGREIRPSVTQSGSFGADLVLDTGILRLFFEKQAEEVARSKAKVGASLTGIIAAHNAYTVYSLMLLYLATGHRPVSAPFERWSDFDFETGLIYVSDKTLTGNRGTRLLKLPTAAREQFRGWKVHLERLSLSLARFEVSELQARIKKALLPSDAFQAPLLFLLGAGGEVVELTAAAQRDAFQKIMPFALNWARHSLRTAMAGHLQSDVIDAWMGHAHYGQSPFKPSSGLRLGDLTLVQRFIEDLMARASARPLESPL